MTWELKYGAGATLRLELAGTAVLADCTHPRGEPLADPAAAVAAAIAEPLDYPPLTKAIVPGDHVAIAVGQGVPRAGEVVAGLVQSLLGNGPALGRISVVVAEEADESTAKQLAILSAGHGPSLEISVHDAGDSAQLAYLAASGEGKPIYFNRALCDADVVVPVGPVRLAGTLGYCGVHGALFPAFSDEASRQRFRAPSRLAWGVQQKRRRAEVDEAAWLLGIQFTIQVVPGAGESILHVAAGASQAVSAAGSAQAEAAWLHRTAERAPLVVATIEGGPQQQTWENFARALYAACQAVADGGAVLLCTGLRCPPGTALRRLAAAGDDQQVLHDLQRDRSSDAISASLLAEVRQRLRVYLLSGLDREFVEDLGVGHVGTDAEAERLSRQFSSCILLGNAQHAAVELTCESEQVVGQAFQRWI
jgi:nickel-dependent lactate racemase